MAKQKTLTVEEVAVLQSPAFRARFRSPSDQGYFTNIDQCIRTVGVTCRRLPHLYNVLVGRVLRDPEGWEWFRKTFPKVLLTGWTAPNKRKAVEKTRTPKVPKEGARKVMQKREAEVAKALEEHRRRRGGAVNHALDRLNRRKRK